MTNKITNETVKHLTDDELCMYYTTYFTMAHSWYGNAVNELIKSDPYRQIIPTDIYKEYIIYRNELARRQFNRYHNLTN